jgi:hypothetical protein
MDRGDGAARLRAAVAARVACRGNNQDAAYVGGQVLALAGQRR